MDYGFHGLPCAPERPSSGRDAFHKSPRSTKMAYKISLTIIKAIKVKKKLNAESQFQDMKIGSRSGNIK